MEPRRWSCSFINELTCSIFDTPDSKERWNVECCDIMVETSPVGGRSVGRSVGHPVRKTTSLSLRMTGTVLERTRERVYSTIVRTRLKLHADDPSNDTIPHTILSRYRSHWKLFSSPQTVILQNRYKINTRLSYFRSYLGIKI